MSGLTADDQNEPWWNMNWLAQNHIVTSGVASHFTGRQAANVGNMTKMPQVYTDHYPSESTRTDAAVLAVPGGYAAAVRRQRG